MGNMPESHENLIVQTKKEMPWRNCEVATAKILSPDPLQVSSNELQKRISFTYLLNFFWIPPQLLPSSFRLPSLIQDHFHSPSSSFIRVSSSIFLKEPPKSLRRSFLSFSKASIIFLFPVQDSFFQFRPTFSSVGSYLSFRDSNQSIQVWYVFEFSTKSLILLFSQ